MNKTLLYDIRPIGPDCIQLSSWLTGDKKASFYFHGEFTSMALVVSAIAARKQQLDIPMAMGEYTSA